MLFQLYAPLAIADILIASPLGMKHITSSKGTDVLSSVEVLVFDQLDVLLMQNWSHVIALVDALHKKPSTADSVDWSRVSLHRDGNTGVFLITLNILLGTPLGTERMGCGVPTNYLLLWTSVRGNEQSDGQVSQLRRVFDRHAAVVR